MKKIILSCTLIVALVSCSDDKSELLKCEKPWSKRTEFEKLIGSWCTEKYRPGVGRTVVSQNMEFSTKICIYSDHTLKEFQLSDSYMNSESEMDSGTDVQVKDGVLSYNSKNYGLKSYVISNDETTLNIDGFITISGNGKFTKCN
jgi:hypothetical protein